MMAAAQPTKTQYMAIRAGRLTRKDACTRKHAYSEAKALRQVERSREHFKDQTLEAYPCIWCDFWHIGHYRVRRAA
jgi:hypothetical protein